MASLPPDDSHTRVATSPSVVVGPFLASVGAVQRGSVGKLVSARVIITKGDLNVGRDGPA